MVDVSRIEVIVTGTGREYSRYLDSSESSRVAFQDEGRTMKVFIEKETAMTQYTEADFARAKFARHPDGDFGARVDLGDAVPWAVTDPDGGECDWRSDASMANDGWIPVKEAPAGPASVGDLRGMWERAEKHPVGYVIPEKTPYILLDADGFLSVFEEGSYQNREAHSEFGTSERRTLLPAEVDPKYLNQGALEALLDDANKQAKDVGDVAKYLLDNGIVVEG